MKTRRLFLVLFGTIALPLSSCAENDADETTTISSTASETSRSSTPTSSSSEETTNSEEHSETPATMDTATVAPSEPIASSPTSTQPQQSAAPTFVECIYGGGSWTSQALMSDGSYQWAAECQQKLDEQRAEAPYQCPQTDYWVPDPWYCDNQMVPWSVPPPSETETPAYLLPDSPEEIAGRQWWSDCMAQNTTEYCRSVDPYVSGY